MENWSKKELEIIELIESKSDAELEHLRVMTKAELEKGNTSMSFAFDRICREMAKRTVAAIMEL